MSAAYRHLSQKSRTPHHTAITLNCHTNSPQVYSERLSSCTNEIKYGDKRSKTGTLVPRSRPEVTFCPGKGMCRKFPELWMGKMFNI